MARNSLGIRPHMASGPVLLAAPANDWESGLKDLAPIMMLIDYKLKGNAIFDIMNVPVSLPPPGGAPARGPTLLLSRGGWRGGGRE